jgi:hypothetical protein
MDLDSAEKIASIAAIVIGGGWVYFNAFRGRTFIPRLDTSLIARVLRNGTKQYVVVEIAVRNVGSSIAEIADRGSWVEVTRDGGSTREAVIPAFDFDEGEIRKIEPGTTITWQSLIEVSDSAEPRIVLLRVAALPTSLGPLRLGSGRKWRTATVAVA